ncbi:uncharacterized protein BKCO1_4500017 [Diplodia corticola]|uniref:DUF7918 domain-containing protein n=1 Tax=Diplodia corticola TaxID=236234 RepID=A0A1J9QUS4_9PEZI|nr:uncharacterized protein BKCO1_4500017 [Diplodia corticola]OJD31722.1 hypothetical protein BKCO1_4500017 [Diplodia corticola]
MAVISSLPGVEAEVRVNGERAEEYVDSSQVDTDNTTTRYIEAISGARFTVHYTIPSACFGQGKDVRVRVYVDGEKVDGKMLLCKKHNNLRKTVTINGASSFQDGKSTISPMIFSDIDIDKQETATLSEEMQKHLRSVGTICVRLHRGLAKTQDRRNRTITMDGIGKVSEKDLKGKPLSHQVKLQAPYKRKAKMYTQTFIAGSKEDDPFAKFTFRYRSRAALQAECIIPRTPSLKPLEERPLEELDPDELRELERDAAASAVKNEIKSEENAGSSGPKRAYDQSELEVVETRPVKRERTCGSAPVVIDLSDD